ncbi:PHP domain-containing protein, partial [Streptomyces sp. B1866]|uniref:PHP domain-containing protein n=1 Tax=Streptomyces sp. B1866 TaxID=3075431 RepID=UPI00288ECC72
MGGFTHLHVASGRSVRYGVSRPERLVERAAERGMDTLALTDRDTVGGVVRFVLACRRTGVRPVLGVDVGVAPALPPAPAARKRTPVRGGRRVPEAAHRVTLLARDPAGWAGLCRLVTAAHAPGGPPAVPWEALRAHLAPGLSVLLGPVSEPVRALAAGRTADAARLLAPWRELAGEHVLLEAVDHGRGGTGPGSLRLAARTVGLAAREGLTAVLTNAVRYADADPRQHRLADVLDAARRLLPVDGRAVDTGERWLKDPRAMAAAAERIARAAGQERGGAARLLAATREAA